MPSALGTTHSNVMRPYRKPKVYVPSESAKDKRVYIRIYIWDVQKEKYHFKKLYAHNGYNFTEHPEFAQTVADQIEEYLAKGQVIDRTKNIEKLNIRVANPDIEVTQALEWALSFKKRVRQTTYKTYEGHVKRFNKFIDQYHPGIPLSSINREVIEQFLVHTRDTRKVGTRAITNHLISLKAMFNVLVEEEWMKKNPIKGFKITTQEMNKNFAYSDKQKFELIDYATHYPYIQFGMRFMYYTLVRSSEMTRIQIREIGMKHPNQLYMPAEKTKTGRERNVLLHPALIRFIEEYKIKDLPDNWYLFGRHFEPSPTKWRESEIGKYYRKKILDPMKYNPRYSLISWKHTGVCTLHRNGVADYEIMTQAGWSTYKAFQNYLKSLGLHRNPDVIDRIDEI